MNKLFPCFIRQKLLLLFLIFGTFLSKAQNHSERFATLDALLYAFEIHLNDTTNRIEGKTIATIRLLKPTKNIVLDFVNVNDSTKMGMTVSSVTENGNQLQFNHKKNRLTIQLTKKLIDKKEVSLEINYTGIPADGLIISKNKFGDRTFFGDNWPNRARYWLPTIDHPSDKATLDFLVYAPNRYQVISNGVLIEETNITTSTKLTHWKESVPLATKLMVIGVARFAVQYSGSYRNIPVSKWVFPQNREIGFADYSFDKKALKFYSELIGRYSYEKLAHVQSKTRYGGMENASCIFYSERSVNGNNSEEALFAHETAHQWFGNSVTEQNWHHIWLSEGFATYLTHIYNQHFHGEKFFRDGMKNDRRRVIAYSKRNFAPIIDTTVTNYNRLLNPNSYQKASWVLHMLREKLGDKIFFAGLQSYYNVYKNSTALTADFKKIMEMESGEDLSTFFHQWLWQPGQPQIRVSFKQKAENKVRFNIKQVQPNYFFTFPLEIEIQYKNGETEIKSITIKDRETVYSTSANGKIESILIDPETKLLFELLQ